MYYRAFATLEDNERNFVIGLALEVNNAKVKKQTIPNKNLIEITKELIKKHKIDFEQFIYVLRTDYNSTFWYDNDFDKIFNEEMFDDLESVLFETEKQLVNRNLKGE